MAIRRRIRKILGWSILLALAVAGGGLTFAYCYVTDSDTLGAMLRSELPRFLPGSRFDVVKVTARPLIGDFELKHVGLSKLIEGRMVPLLRIPHLKICQDVGTLLRGEFHPSRVEVGEPRLRLARRADGTWNFEGLLADPWPYPPPEHAPLILIGKGTLELDTGDATPLTVLHDVDMRLEAGDAPYEMAFKGTAKGGSNLLNELDFAGSYNLKTGRLEITQGKILRLGLAAALRNLPEDFAAAAKQAQLVAGELDVTAIRATFDPTSDRPLSYRIDVDLHDGATSGLPALPFALENISASATIADDGIQIVRARGVNGKTVVRASGTLGTDPLHDPLDITIKVDDLEIDERLHVWTPSSLMSLWPDFSPAGLVDVSAAVRRASGKAEPTVVADIACRDVAMSYHEFVYPVEHIWGTIHVEAGEIDLDLGTSSIGGRPASCRGTVSQPGPDPRVVLDFAIEALPVDDALLKAMPPDVREVIDHFHPRGSVGGALRLERIPDAVRKAGQDEVAITADIRLEERGHCEITWDDLPYKIVNLTGLLKIRPNQWIFEGMDGRNGVARITGSGRVDKVRDGLKVDLGLAAKALPFDRQLREALPANWRTTWEVLNPVGACDVTARVQIEPGQPDHTHLELTPLADTRVQLRFRPLEAATPGAPPRPSGRMIELPPMEQVGGNFVFDDGKVAMRDVKFYFRNSRVWFPSGTVMLEDDNRFDLRVKELWVQGFRLDAGLRQLMPTVMAEFAQRLDEGHTYTFHTDLALGWSGLPGEPAWCAWENGAILFNGNMIQAGLPLEGLHGVIDSLKGRFDGFDLGLSGKLDLDSVIVMGQQVSRLKGDLRVGKGRASLTELNGALLNGRISGWVGVDLETTPHYEVNLAVEGADLRAFTATIPGKQNVSGTASGQVRLEGAGQDLKTLQGQGALRIEKASLGELPAALRMLKVLQLGSVLNPSVPDKTAFDSAEVRFRVEEGLAHLEPIRLVGDAFSLQGEGTVDFSGELDLKLKPAYGRDRFKIDAFREAIGLFADIHVTGPAGNPRFSGELIPKADDAGKWLQGLRETSPKLR